MSKTANHLSILKILIEIFKIPARNAPRILIYYMENESTNKNKEGNFAKTTKFQKKDKKRSSTKNKVDGGMKYLGRIYYEQKGLINLDDIVDIFIEVGNIHNYLENAALRILLFGNPELNFYQCRLLVLKYGESLSQDDLHGRMVFMRMIQLLEANTV